MFPNHHNEQIPKLSLGFQFFQDLMVKMCKNCCSKVNDVYCMSSSRDKKLKVKLIKVNSWQIFFSNCQTLMFVNLSLTCLNMDLNINFWKFLHIFVEIILVICWLRNIQISYNFWITRYLLIHIHYWHRFKLLSQIPTIHCEYIEFGNWGFSSFVLGLSW